MSRISVSTAIRNGLREELQRDDSVILMGEDLATMGSPFAITKGFADEFGLSRIIETPISESGFTGMAVGAAMRGLRPVVELMYNDFISVALDPVMNQAAKLRYMTGGQVTIPLVVRAPMGAGRRNAGQHSACLEALFTHIPGLKVVCPSSAKDSKGLIKAAIRDDDPVIFLEHKLLYARKEEVPDDDFVIPIGQANVVRDGTDVTVLTWSRQVYFALDAADQLAADGISTEIIDLRTLVPLDWDAIAASVAKTHHVVVVEEGVRRGGVGAEISAEISDGLYDELDAPVARVAGANVCSPFSPPLEDEVFPQPDDIAAAIRRVLNR